MAISRWLQVSTSLAVVAGLLLSPASAERSPLPDGFFGEFVGSGVSDAADESGPRELSVSMRPAGDGFEVEWTSIVHKIDGEVRRRHYRLRFRPSSRPGMFASEMRRDMFGNWVPQDPLRGGFLVWASLSGATLSMHGLLILDDGGYEVQTYQRTLIEDGKLELLFRRVRNGEVLRTVRGTLLRVDD